MRRTFLAVLLLQAWAAGSLHEARAESAIRAGEPMADPPTLVCLGVHWPYAGDDNRNASVRVRYRESRLRDAAWREAMPLFRIRPEHVPKDEFAPKDIRRAFAGSIFDLRSGTAYEIELCLCDPDGGSVKRIVRSSTRPVPRAPPGLREVRIAPGRLARALSSARPGQVLILEKGVYKGNFSVDVNGSAERPVVVRGVCAKDVIIDGGGSGTIVSACGAAYVYFENLTFRNGREAIRAHGATGIVVRRCRFAGLGHGLRCTVSRKPGRDFYVADNVFEGPSTWPAEGIEDIEAVELLGYGHVVCHNRIVGFGDAISVFRNPAVSIDFYGNDIDVATDDGIEMDFSDRNTRCFRNRITNSRAAVSLQPIYGGPCYVFRNEMLNTSYGPLKLHNEPSGGVILHNTSVKRGVPLPVLPAVPVRDMYFRNNLFVGDGERSVNWHAAAVDCDMDYDGFGLSKGVLKIGGKLYGTLSAAAKAGYEAHGRLLKAPFFARPVPVPERSAERVRPAEFGLHPRSGAVDAGARLSNVNDGFAGRAPDMGARELGAKPPFYGPRPPPRGFGGRYPP